MKRTHRQTRALKKLIHYGHNKCSVCAGTLPTDVAYAGYNKTGSEIYVGECCKLQLAELYSHIYWTWTNYPRPSRDAPLWRFMDFAKFVAMLRDKGLYFARADTLGDRFEGARGIASREAEWRNFAVAYYRDAMSNLPPGLPPIAPARIEEDAVRLYEEMRDIARQELARTYVSCWHGNDVESEALWRLYSVSGSVGVCVRTCFASLDAAIDDDLDVRFGHVQYIDFKRSFSATHDPVFWKRKSLSHEAEVRGVIVRREAEPNLPGVVVPLNLEAVIEAVIPSPFAPPWFESVLSETIAKFGFKLPLARSELAEDPFF